MIFGYGDSFSSTKLCRLNWRIETFNNVEWIVFENDGRYSSKGLYNPCKSVVQTFYLTPITGEHMLSVCFNQVISKEARGLDEAFLNLRNSIMSTAELSLSDDASREKALIDSQHPDQKYSENLSPYEFDRLPYPDRDKIHDNFIMDKGVDYVNNMSDSAYTKAIDQIEKEERKRYNQRISEIFYSHLRFKK